MVLTKYSIMYCNGTQNHAKVIFIELTTYAKLVMLLLMKVSINKETYLRKGMSLEYLCKHNYIV
jgi:hypothetical protein